MQQTEEARQHIIEEVLESCGLPANFLETFSLKDKNGIPFLPDEFMDATEDLSSAPAESLAVGLATPFDTLKIPPLSPEFEESIAVMLAINELRRRFLAPDQLKIKIFNSDLYSSTAPEDLSLIIKKDEAFAKIVIPPRSALEEENKFSVLLFANDEHGEIMLEYLISDLDNYFAEFISTPEEEDLQELNHFTIQTRNFPNADCTFVFVVIPEGPASEYGKRPISAYAKLYSDEAFTKLLSDNQNEKEFLSNLKNDLPMAAQQALERYQPTAYIYDESSS